MSNSIRSLLAVAVAVLAVPHVSSAADVTINIGRGKVAVHVPPSYDPGVPTPLVMMLHGYTSTGPEEEAYLRFRPLSDEYGFIYTYPTGKQDVLGPFWNATNACCAFFDQPDDSGYLRDLIDELRSRANIDDRRIYVTGHSNGGFMSHRMACDHSDLIAAVASISGATWLNPAQCVPTDPVHVLEIHGLLDNLIRFKGGCTLPGRCYPGAVPTVQQWASLNGCDPTPDLSPPPLDLDAQLPGSETLVGRFANGCVPGGSAELWAIVGGPHTPVLSSDFGRLVIEYFLAHPKP